VGVPKKTTGLFGYVPGCLNPEYSSLDRLTASAAKHSPCRCYEPHKPYLLGISRQASGRTYPVTDETLPRQARNP